MFFWEQSLKKAVSFREQKMSKDKYMGIFSGKQKLLHVLSLKYFATRKKNVY